MDGGRELGEAWLAPTFDKPMAAISWKLAAKVSEPCAWMMVTNLSSIGWCSTSSTRMPNLGSSFKTSQYPLQSTLNAV
jgi:hypothetical protein